MGDYCQPVAQILELPALLSQLRCRQQMETFWDAKIVGRAYVRQNLVRDPLLTFL